MFSFLGVVRDLLVAKRTESNNLMINVDDQIIWFCSFCFLQFSYTSPRVLKPPSGFCQTWLPLVEGTRQKSGGG